MSEFEDLLGTIVTIFVVLLLVYVFFIAFESISPFLAWLFVALAGVIIIGMLIRVFRR